MMISTPIFDQKLNLGRVAESYVAKWLQVKYGYSILPVYDKHFTTEEENNGTKKGPQFFTATGAFAAPDMLCMRDNRLCWVEAKCKSTFTWRRIDQQWQDGIDLHHYRQYCAIADTVPWPIHIMFLHLDTWNPIACREAPEPSETGLFGNRLDILRANEHHQDMRHGRYGMVYWSKSILCRYATLDEVLAVV
jgi:hypothetical protein